MRIDLSDHEGVLTVEVSDDGCGIAFEDMPLAFEPHATSKIRTHEDLLKISTMGFRGEALANLLFRRSPQLAVERFTPGHCDRPVQALTRVLRELT